MRPFIKHRYSSHIPMYKVEDNIEYIIEESRHCRYCAHFAGEGDERHMILCNSSMKAVEIDVLLDKRERSDEWMENGDIQILEPAKIDTSCKFYRSKR